MKALCIILIIIILLIVTFIVGYNKYNELNIINIKMIKSNEKIEKYLKNKYETLNKIVEKLKKNKSCSKYFKEFKTMDITKMDSYITDQKLDEVLNQLLLIIDDNKKINSNEIKNELNELNELNQKLNASKKYFNNCNNNLIKLLKGYTKILAKLFNISVKNSYETKNQ